MARIFTEGFEMGDLLNTDVNVNAIVSTAVKRTGNYAMRVTGGGGYMRKNITGISSGYVRTGAYRAIATVGHYGQIGISFWNGGTQLIEIRQTANLDPLRIYIGGTLVASGNTVPAAYRWYLVEVYVKIDDTEGEVTVKLNGIPEVTFNGNTKPGAETTFDNIRFGNPGIGSTTYIYYDDIAINDTTGDVDNSWCGDGRVILIRPNGDGDHIDFMNSAGSTDPNYTFVDEIPSDGNATYVYPSTEPANEYDLYTLETPSLPDNAIIARVWAEARAKSPTTDHPVAILLRGTMDTEGPATILGTSYQPVISAYHTMNDVGEQWSSIDFDNLQAGVIIK